MPNNTNEVATFDTTPYESAPMVTTDAILNLLKSLQRAKPKNAPAHVEKTAKQLGVTAAALEQNMVDRVESAGINSTKESAFDFCCGRFWGDTRNRLEYVRHYADVALDMLDAEAQAKIDLEHQRSRAAVAEDLDNHLFGIDGLEFLKKPFAQQVEQMASRLEFIRSSHSTVAYRDVLGDELLNTLEVLQARYDTMVHDRSTREAVTGTLSELRQAAQRHITAYSRAVLTMLDEDNPKESRKLVEDALRPIAKARSSRASTSEVETPDQTTDAVETVSE